MSPGRRASRQGPVEWAAGSQSFSQGANLVGLRWRFWGGESAAGTGFTRGFHLPFSHIPAAVVAFRLVTCSNALASTRACASVAATAGELFVRKVASVVKPPPRVRHRPTAVRPRRRRERVSRHSAGVVAIIAALLALSACGGRSSSSPTSGSTESTPQTSSRLGTGAREDQCRRVRIQGRRYAPGRRAARGRDSRARCRWSKVNSAPAKREGHRPGHCDRR
jgi:hypothetical protein